MQFGTTHRHAGFTAKARDLLLKRAPSSPQLGEAAVVDDRRARAALRRRARSCSGTSGLPTLKTTTSGASGRSARLG